MRNSVHRIAPLIAAALLTGAPAASAHPGKLHIPKPDVAVAVTAGEIDTDVAVTGRILGLSGRLDFGRLALAAEAGSVDHGDEWRIDRYLGVGIYAGLTRSGPLRLFGHGGAGLNLIELGGNPVYQQISAQLGIGVALRLSAKLDLTVEGIAGRRRTVRTNPEYVILGYIGFPERQQFTQTRVGLLLSF